MDISHFYATCGDVTINRKTVWRCAIYIIYHT